jgi:hypothetical protein
VHRGREFQNVLALLEAIDDQQEETWSATS